MPGVEGERGALAVPGAGDLAKNDPVVADGDGLVDGALRLGQGVLDQGYPGVGHVEVAAGEVVLSRSGEDPRHVLLARRQDGDPEAAARLDGVPGTGAVPEGDHQDRRFQADGGQGVDGHTLRGTVLEGGDHGDAGDEVPHGAAHREPVGDPQARNGAPA